MSIKEIVTLQFIRSRITYCSADYIVYPEDVPRSAPDGHVFLVYPSMPIFEAEEIIEAFRALFDLKLCIIQAMYVSWGCYFKGLETHSIDCAIMDDPEKAYELWRTNDEAASLAVMRDFSHSSKGGYIGPAAIFEAFHDDPSFPKDDFDAMYRWIIERIDKFHLFVMDLEYHANFIIVSNQLETEHPEIWRKLRKFIEENQTPPPPFSWRRLFKDLFAFFLHGFRPAK